MYKHFVFALSLIAGNATAVSAAVSDKTIHELDSKLNRAISAGDAEIAKFFYDDDFVLTTSSGARKNKAAMLRDIATPQLHFDVNETHDVQVRTSGNTAVLVGVLHQKGNLDGKPFDYEVWVTDTWIRGGKHGWRLFAGHATRINGK